jgi:DNA-binding response OmpR family regulator
MPRRVLLTHSDPAVIDLASRALERIGVPVDVATRGAAVEAIDYDVMLIELAAADDLLERVKSAAPVRPVVIVTALPGAAEKLDPESIGLVVPTPYDAGMVVGVVLACVAAEAGPRVPLPVPPRGEGPQVV